MFSELAGNNTRFLTAEEAHDQILQFVSRHAEVAKADTIGQTEEGRSILGVTIGTGSIQVSLLAGAHADEPVGPDTLRRMIPALLDSYDQYQSLFQRVTFCIIPHVNPDGEERNRSWIDTWPDWKDYTRHVVRELPGRDVEFSYPDRRMENKAVSSWLESRGTFALHMSLHGMGFSDGAMLLIEKNWAYRTEMLQREFTDAAAESGFTLHDHNRKGEKGFFQIAPGFTTTPEGVAMRTYFLSHGDHETAKLFGDSSMEFVRQLGGDPLSIVTELPLFVVEGPASVGEPTSYLEFRNRLPEIRLALERKEDLSSIEAQYGLKPVPLETASRLQLTALDLAIKTVLSE